MKNIGYTSNPALYVVFRIRLHSNFGSFGPGLSGSWIRHGFGDGPCNRTTIIHRFRRRGNTVFLLHVPGWTRVPFGRILLKGGHGLRDSVVLLLLGGRPRRTVPHGCVGVRLARIVPVRRGGGGCWWVGWCWGLGQGGGCECGLGFRSGKMAIGRMTDVGWRRFGFPHGPIGCDRNLLWSKAMTSK